MFQGKNLKIIAITALVLALSHCQGANGRRVFGGQAVVVPNQNQKYNTAVPQFPQKLLASIFPSQQKPVTPTPTVKSFDMTAINWSDECAKIIKDAQKDLKDAKANDNLDNKDTDHDGITDQCENALFDTHKFEYSALDPSVFNGVLISGAYFNPNSSKVRVEGQDRKNFSQDRSLINIKGFGTITSSSRPLIQKISSLDKTPNQPVIAFSEFFQNNNDGFIGVEDRLLSYKRSPELFKNVEEDKNIALARADGSEQLGVYAHGNDDQAFYRMTGLQKAPSTESVMAVAEFHTVFPTGVDPKMDITIGYPSGNGITTSKNNFYFLMNDGVLFPASGSDSTAKNFTTIYPSAGCQTAQVVIANFTDGTTNLHGQSSPDETVLYRLKAGEPWRPLSQGIVSTQPMGGNTCDEKFNYSDPEHKNMFFKIPTALTSRVRGIVNFNDSLGSSTEPNGELSLSGYENDSGNIGKILNGALGAGTLFEQGKVVPIKTMDADRLDKLERTLSLLNIENLSPEDKALYDKVIQAIAARRAELATPVVKVQTDPKIIQLSESGTISLDYITMSCLAKLGFAFADEQGNAYVPKDGDTKKISQTVLDQILTQIGKMLDEDKITPEQVDCLLTWLTSDAMKNNPRVIKFMSDYGDKLNGLKPGEEMIRYLRKLNKDLGLGVEKAIDEFAKNDPATKAGSFQTIDSAIEKKLLDPSPSLLTTLPFKDRFDIAKNLLTTKFLNDEQYAALVMKIAALKYARDFEVRKDGNLQLRRSTITFNPGSNKLKSEEVESTLAYIADAIQRFKTDAQIKDVRIQVVAHTDNTPTNENAKTRKPKNKRLSLGRAQAVADFLSGQVSTQQVTYTKGPIPAAKPHEFDKPLEPELVIDSKNIEIVGMGEETPLPGVSNKTPAGRAKNRRVEVVILKKSK